MIATGDLRSWLEHVAGRYAWGELTLERAARLAGVSIYDMMAYVRRRGILPPEDVGELQADVADMLVRRGYSELAQQALRAERASD